ncbi:hypothetical protein K7432_008912 [Basidiobolus ranarum]|uniref:Uncharacterized protein n=1 Tax=Basidiobolus ranarum TaxID=34480 RepID=A0ABR2VYA8_9FUNG
MLFQKSRFNTNTVRPLVARSTRQTVPRPLTSTVIRQLSTNSSGRSATPSNVLTPVLHRFRGSLMPQSSTAGVTRLNNDTRSRFHTATADSYYPLPSNTQLFGEFFHPNAPSYFANAANTPIAAYATQPQQNDPELPWEDFTLYDEDGPAGEFSWDVASFTPALFAPLAEVFASAISNTNEAKPIDPEPEQESAFVSDEHSNSYERQ